MKSYVVLGGGISGLSAAWKLSRNNRANVTLIERSDRVGGWMRSERTEHGSVFELGPRSLRTAGTQGKQTLNLITEIGLDSQVLPASKAAKTRFIWTDNHKLIPVPSSLKDTLKTVPPLTKPLLRTVLKEPITKRQLLDDESVYDFFCRRFGNEVADYFVDPLCRGIYAGKAKHLSIKSCFSQLFELEQKYGSVILGGVAGSVQGLLQPQAGPISTLSKRAKQQRWSIYTLQNGLQSLPDVLHQKLSDQATIVTNTSCTKLIFTDNGTVKVHTDKNVLEADHVVSAVPSKVLASLLDDDYSQLQQLLCTIPSVTTIVVNFEYKDEVLPPTYRSAFGYLVPSHQSPKILGVVFDSSVFPEQNGDAKTRLTVMMGGAWYEELFSTSTTASDIEQVALDAIRHSLGINQDPTMCHVSVHKDSIPQYNVGFSKTLESIHQYISTNSLPITLVGSSYRGVSVNDCVHNTMLAVSQL